MEMPAEQIVSNLLCMHCRLDTRDFRSGRLDQDEWDRLMGAWDDMEGLPLYIDDTPGLSIMDLRARARRLQRRHEIELFVVDYLQLMSAGSGGRENRATEVAEISRGLKALARELEVPVIAVAQLNRRVEQEQRRPRMSDLRESGAIEQDADVILLLHRPHQEPDESDEPPLDDETPMGHEALLIIAKQRNGPIGDVRLVFIGNHLRFESRSGYSPRR
jgi:replicative DNA helicase